MSGWVQAPDNIRDGYECIRLEYLFNDKDEYLGSVMQFYEGHPAYANCLYGRIGPCMTFDQAKTAVEKAIEGGKANASIE